MTNMNDLLTAANKRDSDDQETLTVFLWDGFDTSGANEALHKLNEGEKTEFVRKLIETWSTAMCYSYNEEGIEALSQIVEIFGERIKPRTENALMFTLTPNGKQFRAWYSRPGYISEEHADSCGHGCLFSVYGPPRKLERFVEAALGPRSFENGLKVPNGAKIFGFIWGN